MTEPPTTAEKLRQLIDDFFEGTQKRFADEYGVSQSQVSAWLKAKTGKLEGSEKPEVPIYIDKIVDHLREVRTLTGELKAMRTGRVLAMESGYAIVHFPSDVEPGTILCRGISDLDTANRVLKALLTAEAPHTSKES